MRATKLTAAPIAAAALMLALTGCNGEGDLIDTIGAQVDPYAANVEAMRAQNAADAENAQEPVEDEAAPAADADAPAAETEQTPEEEAQDEPLDYADDSHYEGEFVAVGSDAYAVNASWIRDGNGAWAAAFYTYNGTQINSYQVDGGWRFYTVEGREVVSSDSSLNYGQYGPAGIESYWRDAADPNIWY